MINNARNDGKQYFLTAYHCVGDISEEEIGFHILGFNYQRKGCLSDGKMKVFPNDTAQGLRLVSKNRLSDYALLEVMEKIPTSYGVFLSGWSRSPNSIIGEPYIGIHHPSAGIKKVTPTHPLSKNKQSDFIPCQICRFHFPLQTGL
jgi:lysyl endopeptidase